MAPLEASETDGVLHGGAVPRSLERDGDDRIFSPSADAVAGTRRRTRFCFTRFGCMRSFLQSTFTAVFNRAQDTGKLASRVLYVGQQIELTELLYSNSIENLAQIHTPAHFSDLTLPTGSQ